MTADLSVYAEVVVDIPNRELGDKLFTYRIPAYLQSDTFIGTQVLVPFGNQELVGGYVVSIKDEITGDFKPKEVVEVLDNDPLFDRNYIEFLHWIAEYYSASLSSVITAAIPADFGPRLKRKVELVDIENINAHLSNSSLDNACKTIIKVLSSSNNFSLSVRALKQRSKLSFAHCYRSTAQLRQMGIVQIKLETGKQLTPKLISTVIWTGNPPTTLRQENIVSLLKRHSGQLPVPQLIELAGTTYATIKTMISKGILLSSSQESIRDPMLSVEVSEQNKQTEFNLTEDQQNVLSVLSENLKTTVGKGPSLTESIKPWLLHGVTGSGKTEIYLRLIQQTLNYGLSAMLLVPEISLTPQLAQRLKARFSDKVAVWHSKLSPGERYDTWRRLRAQDVRVLLGARSAVLANMPDLGLIILDEEHDSSYKQSSPNPRYHAKTVALEKARLTGALVLLGSATPDVATYFQANNDQQLLELPERVYQQPMPSIEIVDMRKEYERNYNSVFSQTLLNELADCLDRQQQAILLINRRGYSSHVFCRACGFVIKCRNCSVSLVFHQNNTTDSSGYMECHHCGFRCSLDDDCPNCSQPFLKQYGLGTQKVEQDVQKLFPDAKILRLDSDIAARKGAYQDIFSQFESGKADILIGTQMVAKGLDIPKVTLVGVLSADCAFNLPDYRSMERGFQLLTQVSGRAGRGVNPGKVILQTYNTELPALVWAKMHNYSQFYEEEIKTRKLYGYPPFSQIIRLVVAGADLNLTEAATEQLSEELSRFLDNHVEPEAIKILGPAPCLIEKLRGNFRQHLLIKNLIGIEGKKVVTNFVKHVKIRAGISLAIDIDATELL